MDDLKNAPNENGGKPEGGNQDPAKSEAPAGGNPEGANGDPQGGNPEDALGDAGKKALQTERTARKEAERKLKELEAEVSRLRRSNAAVKDIDLDAIKDEIRKEFDAKLLSAEIKAAASGKMADPADAMRYGDYFEGLSADDSDGIKSAIEKLLKEKPYLSAQDSGPKPWGDVGGGPRETPAEPEPRNAQERLARFYSRKSG